MPELPEVQTTVNGINHKLRGQKILDVWTDYGGIIHKNKSHIKNHQYFKKFRENILGRKILSATRRGKNVLIHISDGFTMLIHMKMTGHLLYGKYKKLKTKTKDTWKAVGAGPLKDDPYNQFIHLVFSLSSGKHLTLSDVRKFAKVCILKTENLEETEFRDLGPEPLDKSLKLQIFKQRLKKRPDSRVKQALMDQRIIAGVGNIYSDEILWASNVHPLRTVSKLSGTEFKGIWDNMRRILKRGIRFRGDSLSDYRNLDGKKGAFQYEHKAYQKTGKSCSKIGCRGKIERIVIGGRSAHFCPSHQA